MEVSCESYVIDGRSGPKSRQTFIIKVEQYDSLSIVSTFGTVRYNQRRIEHFSDIKLSNLQTVLSHQKNRPGRGMIL